MLIERPSHSTELVQGGHMPLQGELTASTVMDMFGCVQFASIVLRPPSACPIVVMDYPEHYACVIVAEGVCTRWGQMLCIP